MARCRCGAGTCECHIIAGQNITLSGVGDTNDPWIIASSPSARGVINLLDNQEVVFNQVGSGVPADPYNVTASLPWIDPLAGETGEVLTKAADGSWQPGPPASAVTDSLVFDNTVEVGFTVTGGGLPTDPYHVTAALPWVDPTTGTTGQVLAKQADGTWAPAPPATAAPGAVLVGDFLVGDGSAGSPIRTALVLGHGVVGSGTLADPLRLCLTTYDDLKLAADC